MASEYDIGDSVVLTSTFTVSGTLTNPGAVTVTIKLPDGTTTTPSASNVSTGVYRATYTTTQAGTHWVRFLGTPPAQGAEEISFSVRPSRVL